MDYIPPKPKVVDEALESFKNLIIKFYNKRYTFFHLKESKSALTKFVMQYRMDRQDWIDPGKLLASHHDYYKSYEAIKIELPGKGSKISFKNHIR